MDQRQVFASREIQIEKVRETKCVPGKAQVERSPREVVDQEAVVFVCTKATCTLIELYICPNVFNLTIILT